MSPISQGEIQKGKLTNAKSGNYGHSQTAEGCSSKDETETAETSASEFLFFYYRGD